MEVVQFFAWPKSLVFFFAAATLLAVSSDCEAQLFRRHRARAFDSIPAYANSNIQLSSGYQANSLANQPIASRLPKWPFGGSGYDPRIHRDADAGAKYPKYIGGFHSSHFTNVGLPSGDIGFRGNGLYWAPW